MRNLSSPENKIYNIEDFNTYEVEINFNRPDIVQNDIINMTLEVENECPVAKEFGEIGIGEGIVFSCLMQDGSRHIFKSKGEKHAGQSKVKTLKPVDDEKVNKIHDIVNKVTPAWRLDQMVTESCDLNNGGSIDRAKLGDYLRMVINDVMKEEMDIISEAGLEPKDINKHISQVAREYFFDRERADLGVN